jgi:hypothetical protein
MYIARLHQQPEAGTTGMAGGCEKARRFLGPRRLGAAPRPRRAIEPLQRRGLIRSRSVSSCRVGRGPRGPRRVGGSACAAVHAVAILHYTPYRSDDLR